MNWFERLQAINPGAKPEIFQERRGLFEKVYFDKQFIENTWKKYLEGKKFGLFLLDTLKAVFEMKNLTHR